jgi:hypothetical protein
MEADDLNGRWFTDAADARGYLNEIGRLWTAWLVVLASQLALDGIWLVVSAVALLAAWLVLGRPLQRRAAALVDDESEDATEDRQTAAAMGKQRDRIMRELIIGQAPLEAALAINGSSPRWAYARIVVIALTIAAFVVIIREFGFGS